MNYFYKIFKDGMLEDIIIFQLPSDLPKDEFEDILAHYRMISDGDMDYVCEELENDYGVLVFHGLTEYN